MSTKGEPGNRSIDETAIICGTGLIGTSVGYDLLNAGWNVGLQDPDKDNLGVAYDRLRQHAADVGRTAIIDEPDATYDLAIVASPPHQVVPVVRGLLAAGKAKRITDVASVKTAIVQESVAEGFDPAVFVPAHPMGGLETSGPAAAVPGLFEDRRWPITPLPGTPQESIASIKRLAEQCRAIPVVMSPEEHDRAVAHVSHLMHLGSVAAAASAEGLPPWLTQVAGGGWGSMTRLARARVDGMWLDIFDLNRAPILAALGEYLDILHQLHRAIAEGDTSTIRAIHETANATEAGVAAAQQSAGQFSNGSK